MRSIEDMSDDEVAEMLGTLKKYLRLAQLDLTIRKIGPRHQVAVFSSAKFFSLMTPETNATNAAADKRYCDGSSDWYEDSRGALAETWWKMLNKSLKFEKALCKLAAYGNEKCLEPESWRPFEFSSYSELKMKLAMCGL